MHTICAPVAPDLIVVAWAVHSRPQRLFPLEPILKPVPSLHIASSRKSQKAANQIQIMHAECHVQNRAHVGSSAAQMLSLEQLC